ncbi:hypothetical protein JXB12_02900 [candidate division KSB1 bacterium]|nr:hypothetical protein [candidate division KSB1 bacterium]
MVDIVMAFAPAFAAGFALQQFIEIISPIFDLFKDHKKIIINIFSLVVGLILAFVADFRVLKYLGAIDIDLWDACITGLIISAGTEGFNSIMKFLGYAKERQKIEAKISDDE